MKNKADENIIKACILGHAVGDALGVPVEFRDREQLDRDPVTDMRGYGTYCYPAGCWSDDTSMTLCALESLSEGKLDYDDVMRNFGTWYRTGEFTPTGSTFDVGGTCASAIYNYFVRHKDIKHCGLTDEQSNGNGSLMRIIPFVLYAYYTLPDNGMKMIYEIVSDASAITHAHKRARMGCEIYATMLISLLEKSSRDELKKDLSVYGESHRDSSEYIYYKNVVESNAVEFLRSEISGSGYVVDTLEAAYWCFMTTDSYRDCVLKAVNLGEDTDSVAAVAGGLAGAFYGLDAIPKGWLDTLKRRDYIEDMCERAAAAWNTD